MTETECHTCINEFKKQVWKKDQLQGFAKYLISPSPSPTDPTLTPPTNSNFAYLIH